MKNPREDEKCVCNEEVKTCSKHAVTTMPPQPPQDWEEQYDKLWVKNPAKQKEIKSFISNLLRREKGDIELRLKASYCLGFNAAKEQTRTQTIDEIIGIAEGMKQTLKLNEGNSALEKMANAVMIEGNENYNDALSDLINQLTSLKE